MSGISCGSESDEQRSRCASGGSLTGSLGFKDFKLKGGVLPGEQEIDMFVH